MDDASQLGYADGDEVGTAKSVYQKLEEARTRCIEVLNQHEAVRSVLSTNHHRGGSDYHIRLVDEDMRADIEKCLRGRIHSIITCKIVQNVGSDKSFRVSLQVDEQAADDYTEGSRDVCIPLGIFALVLLFGLFLWSVRTGGF